MRNQDNDSAGDCTHSDWAQGDTDARSGAPLSFIIVPVSSVLDPGYGLDCIQSKSQAKRAAIDPACEKRLYP